MLAVHAVEDTLEEAGYVVLWWGVQELGIGELDVMNGEPGKLLVRLTGLISAVSVVACAGTKGVVGIPELTDSIDEVPRNSLKPSRGGE
jgi:hypothetical protein